MAGPRMIGIRDVVNPVEGLQDSVSRVGDIYQNYEKDRRASEVHAQQMAEAERAENARQYLRDYTPEFGGADFKGIDADTKKAMILEEGNILKNLAEAGADPEKYKSVTSEIIRRRKDLVTREAVTADVFNDLIRNGVDSETAKHLAAIEGSKYDSLDDRVKSEMESAKAADERRNKQAEIAIDAMKARKPTFSRTGSTTRNNDGNSTRVVQVLDTGPKVKEFFDNEISSTGIKIDSNAAYGNLKSAVREVNKRRIAAGEKGIGFGDISNLILFSTTSGEYDNDVVYQSSGEWQDAIETYLRTSGGSNRQGGYGGVVPTEDEERAIVAALRGTGPKVRSRAELAATRVRGVYGDLYKTLKSTEVDEDGEIKVLGGTSNSGVGRSTGTRADENSPSRLPAQPVPSTEGGGTASEVPVLSDSERERKAARISELRNRSYRTRSANRELTRLVRELNNTPAVDQPTPTVNVKENYERAVENGLGRLVPEQVYRTNLSGMVRNYTPEQLTGLSSNISEELGNYRAMLAYAEQQGDARQASVARSRIRALEMAAGYVNSRLD